MLFHRRMVTVMMVASNSVPMAFKAEIDAFDAALIAYVKPYGMLADFGLLETREALTGLMTAIVEPYGFRSPYQVNPEDQLKQAYGTFIQHPYEQVMLMDLFWLSRMVEITKQRLKSGGPLQASPEVRKLLSQALVEKIEETALAQSLSRHAQSPHAEAFHRLHSALDQCLRVAITWRLRDSEVAPDFPDLAIRTVMGILLCSVTARLATLMTKELKALEMLLHAGVLPLGVSGDGTVYGVRFYKTSEEQSEVPRHTMAVNLPVIKPAESQFPGPVNETIMGIGARGPTHVGPRHALMIRMKELADQRKLADQRILNEPFRLWSGFMKTHIEHDQGFVFGPVPEEALQVVHAATGHAPVLVQIYDIHTKDEMSARLVHMTGVELDNASLAFKESQDKYNSKNRKTIRNPFGLPIWADPYLEEQAVLNASNEYVAALAAQRLELRAALAEHLAPALNKSLETMGMISTGFREIVTHTVQQTFFRYFEAALQGDTKNILLVGRLIDLMRNGVIPIGSRLDNMGRPVLSVMAKD